MVTEMLPVLESKVKYNLRGEYGNRRGAYHACIYIYIFRMILFFEGTGIWSRVFFVSASVWHSWNLEFLGQNRLVRAPSSGGGSNAPRPALSVLHLDVNADRR